jgi:hypothetical protein
MFCGSLNLVMSGREMRKPTSPVMLATHLMAVSLSRFMNMIRIMPTSGT